MKSTLTFLGFIMLFIFLLTIFYSGGLDHAGTENIFLTLCTFLFALFSGFITARQSNRYGEIRGLLARFDGNISALYRLLGHFGNDTATAAGQIAEKHANAVIINGWDYALREKTSTITDYHALLSNAVEKHGTDGAKNAAIGQILTLLREMQVFRKQLVALYKERVPGYQWGLLYLLGADLLLIVSILPSEGVFVSSLIKASFVITVIVVLMLLRRLDNLSLFTGSLGEESARDILDILKGAK